MNIENNENNFTAEERAPREDIVAGRNPVMEAVRADKEIDKLFVQRGATGSVAAIIAKCRDKGVPVKEVTQQKLDFMTGGVNHQGVAAQLSCRSYSTVEELLDYAAERGEPPFLIICDGLEDPHNLGAIIRTAEACGVHGVIIPKNRSVTLNATVSKASSGALEHMRVARVNNITATIELLKKHNVWVYGADMGGSDWCTVDMNGAAAIVIGNEGKGISRLVLKSCDVTVGLPMYGKVNSLNASVAAGVLMYEAARQRHSIKLK